MGLWGHGDLPTRMGQGLMKKRLGQIGFRGVFEKIDAGANPRPKANVSMLTFHYRQILQWACGLVGVWWLWSKVGAESGSKHLV